MIYYLLFIFLIKICKFYFIEIIYNFIFLFNLYKLYYNYPTINSNHIDNLIKSIDNLGIFAIKLVQWGLARFKLYNKDTILNFDKLEKYYEQCPIHSDNYTYDILYNEYKVDFRKKFKLKVIASGSIAQVYKLTSLKNNKIYALKIIHPKLRSKLLVSKIIIKIIITIYKFISRSKLIYLDLASFFNYIDLQLDLRKEYNYQTYFYKNLRNKFVIIPKPIISTKNTLIMSFIEGEKFDDLDISYYKKAKIIQDLKMFSFGSYYNKKFIHADLHNGNWKVKFNSKINRHQLIIYDFGLCYDVKNFDIFTLREHLSEGKINLLTDKLLDIIIDCQVDRNSNEYLLYKNQFIHIMEETNYIKTMDFTLIIPILYKFLIDNHIKINSDLLLLFILIIVFDNNISKLKEKVSEFNNNLENYDYPRMLYYCKTYNLYKNIELHIENYLNKNKTTQCLFNYIDDKYAHLNSSDSDSD